MCIYIYIYLCIYWFICFICTLYPTWIQLLLNFLAENPRSSNCRNNRVQNWGSIHQQHLRPVEIADAAQLVLHHHLEKGPAVPKKPVLVQGDCGVGVDRRSEILTCKRCSELDDAWGYSYGLGNLHPNDNHSPLPHKSSQCCWHIGSSPRTAGWATPYFEKNPRNSLAKMKHTMW